MLMLDINFEISAEELSKTLEHEKQLESINDISEKIISKTLEYCVAHESHLSWLKRKNSQIFVDLLITNDEFMTDYNFSLRKIAKPTNVLSVQLFSNDELNQGDVPLQFALGQLIVSMETTVREAVQYNVSVYNHYFRLLIHGTLHLLGYDHQDDNQAENMLELEKSILNCCNIHVSSLVDGYFEEA